MKLHVNALYEMIDHCTQEREIPITQRVVNQVLHKKRTNREFRLSAQIGEYDVDNVILDLGSDVNVLPKKTWEMMGKTKLIWSPVQLRLGKPTQDSTNWSIDRSTCEYRWGAQCSRL
jgi:hypothetical protein